MSNLPFGSFTLALAVTLSGSLAFAQPNPVPSQSVARPASHPEPGIGPGGPRIRIGPGDLLQINVFDVPELDQSVRVDDKGQAVFSLVGLVNVSGLTAAEAQAALEKRLKDGDYVRQPHVSILIEEYATQGASVLGEVTNPGVYPVLGTRTLLDIISAAGGLTHYAAHEATIKRKAGGEVLTSTLSARPGELLASNVEIYPGDTVIVSRAGIVYVMGDVGRPGGFVMENTGGMTLLQALSMAGGANRTASLGRTRIVRKNSSLAEAGAAAGGAAGSGLDDIGVDLKKVLQGKTSDVALQPEDIVYVPLSVAKSLLERSPQVLETAAASANLYTLVPK